MIKGVRFPGRYLQGPGCITRIGRGAGLGARALIVLDGGVFDLLRDTVLGGGDAEIGSSPRPVNVRKAEINRIRKEALAFGADVIVGIGGGKALDTTKAVADDVGKPVIVIPTIAASDAPCSALAVVGDGTVAYDRCCPETQISSWSIPRSSPRHRPASSRPVSVTHWQPTTKPSPAGAGAHNCLDLPGCKTAYALARACRDTIFEHGGGRRRVRTPTARRRSKPSSRPTSCFPGSVSESGGVAAAHAVHHGLCELDEVHHFLHGEKVAIGVLAGLKLPGDTEEFERVRAFAARSVCQHVCATWE